MIEKSLNTTSTGTKNVEAKNAKANTIEVLEVNSPTPTEIAMMVLRVLVGVIFTLHGLQKIFVTGLEDVTYMMKFFSMPSSVLSAIVVILTEFLGGIALILGVGTRLVSAVLAFAMLMAIGSVHLANGFFVSKGGIEYALLLMVVNVVLVVDGAPFGSILSMQNASLKNLLAEFSSRLAALIDRIIP